MKVCCFVMLLCAIGASAHGQQKSVEDRLGDLERRVSTLEKTTSPPSALSGTQQATPQVGETNAPLQLTSWEYRFVRGEYSQYHYNITVTLKNTSDKDIKLIDGTVQFVDLLGTRVYGIKISPDLHIPADKTVTDKGEYSVNQFIPEQARMAQMKKEDIKAALVVRRLVFADNSVGDYAP